MKNLLISMAALTMVGCASNPVSFTDSERDDFNTPMLIKGSVEIDEGVQVLRKVIESSDDGPFRITSHMITNETSFACISQKGLVDMPFSTLAKIASEKLVVVQDNVLRDSQFRQVYGDYPTQRIKPNLSIVGAIIACDKIEASSISRDLDLNFGKGSGDTITDLGYDRKDMLDKMCLRLRVIDNETNTVIPGTNTENCVVTKKISKQLNSGVFVYGSGWGHSSGVTGTFGVDSSTMLLVDLSILQVIGKIFGMPVDLMFKQSVALNEDDIEDLKDNFRSLNYNQQTMILQHMVNTYHGKNLRVDGLFGKLTWTPVVKYLHGYNTPNSKEQLIIQAYDKTLTKKAGFSF